MIAIKDNDDYDDYFDRLFNSSYSTINGRVWLLMVRF